LVRQQENNLIADSEAIASHKNKLKDCLNEKSNLTAAERQIKSATDRTIYTSKRQNRAKPKQAGNIIIIIVFI
jgi:hypothetical protein